MSTSNVHSDNARFAGSSKLKRGTRQHRFFLANASGYQKNAPAVSVIEVMRLAGAVSAWLLLMPLAAASDDAERIAFFENKVRPLLIKHCYECHCAEEEISGGLALDWRGGWASGGDSGPVIVPGSPKKSLLMTAVRYEDVDYEMPPDGKLAESEIAILEKWIAFGAPDPRVDAPGTITPDSPRRSGTASDVTPAGELWSFQPIGKPAVPEVSDADWTVEPIDAFVRAKLDDAGLPPAPLAENRILLRRLYLDLIGLPPTPEQLQFFQQQCEEDRSAAIEETVDELLASPEFGQRWARHWLDLTAYADTIGVGRAIPAVEAYRYRDYVIDAFNSDKPLPEFIRQQVAGDIRVPGAPGQKATSPPTAEDIIATGFLAIGPWELVSGDKEQLRMDVVDRQVNRIGKAFLGMTLECARCHSHKFDPISQEDYFAMAGILRSSITLNGRLNGVFSQINHVSLPESPDELIERAEWIKQYEEQLAEAQRQAAKARKRQQQSQRQLDALKKQIPGAKGTPKRERENQGNPKRERGIEDPLQRERGIPTDVTQSLADASEDQSQSGLAGASGYQSQLKEAEQELADAKAAAAKATKRVRTLEYLRPHRTQRLAIAMSDRPEPEPAAINIRGNAHQLGDVVPRGYLRSIAPTDEPRLKIGTSGRVDLANWIADVKNPVTSRVWVNRIWHHLFGVGIVRTVDNFGSTGESPSHPHLLDYLASEFQKDWSTKNLIRRIVLSRSWQQSSVNSLASAAGAVDVDPENRLLWRSHRSRMDAETLHDSMLLVSGRLNRGHQGGPSLPLEHADNLTPNATGIAIKGLKLPESWRGRRAVFLPQRRADPFDEVSFLTAFDLPSTNSETGMRTVDALPPQALNLVNSEFVLRQAQSLADRVADLGAAEKVTRLYSLVYGRSPSTSETESAIGFVETIRSELSERTRPNPESQAWVRLCQALLMSNEFLFRT